MLLPNQVEGNELNFPKNTIESNEPSPELNPHSQFLGFSQKKNIDSQMRFSPTELEESKQSRLLLNSTPSGIGTFKDIEPIKTLVDASSHNPLKQDEVAVSSQSKIIGELRPRKNKLIGAVSAEKDPETKHNLQENTESTPSIKTKITESNFLKQENADSSEINKMKDNLNLGSRTFIDFKPIDQEGNELVENEPIEPVGRTGAEEIPKQQESHRAASAGQDDGQRLCRICFESEENEDIGTLIQPCRCTGSMKWIHNECLKTWIVAKGQSIQRASCELCGTSFNMKFKYRAKFRPKDVCRDNSFNVFSCACLSLIIMGLIAVIIFIAAKWRFPTDPSNPSSTTNSFAFKITIIVACALITLILTILVIFSVRDTFFIQEVSEWTILSPDLTKPRVNNSDDFIFHIQHSDQTRGIRRSGSQDDDGLYNSVPSQQNIEANAMQPEAPNLQEERGATNNSVHGPQENPENRIQNEARQSGLAPSESISRFLRQENHMDLNTSTHKLLQEEESKTKNTYKARTLHKNYSANNISNTIPLFFGTEGKMKKVTSQNKVNADADTKQLQSTQLKQNFSDSRLLIKDVASEENKSQDKALKGKNTGFDAHTIFYQKIPKEFISKAKQEKTKTIEVVIDNKEIKPLKKGGKSDNDLLRSNVLTRNESGTKVISTQYRIETTKASFLAKPKSSIMLGPVYIIK